MVRATKPNFSLKCFFFCCGFLNKVAIGLVRSAKCLIINLNIQGWLEEKKKKDETFNLQKKERKKEKGSE